MRSTCLRHLQKKLGGRVSYERVIAGVGIKSVYDFLRDAREDGRAGMAEGADGDAKIQTR